MQDHREIAFESAVEHSLLSAGGYEKGNPNAYDRARALHPVITLEFVQQTQPKPWKTLTDYYGNRADESFLDELTKALEE
jgi:type I restriction enzyme R subunit